jgi:hypothetical protein
MLILRSSLLVAGLFAVVSSVIAIPEAHHCAEIIRFDLLAGAGTEFAGLVGIGGV